MYTMGIDIGSASSKVVILENGNNMIAKVVIPNGTGTSGPARALEEAFNQCRLSQDNIERTIATGYGRMTFQGADKQISEITCHAKGVLHLFPTVRTIIDIGGQDAKVIQLNSQGIISNFVMNDKCAAGTGRFLEVMARVLEVDLEGMGELSDQSEETIVISSTCTVFAESEVISQLANGIKRADVAAGVHESVVRRVTGLVLRIGSQADIVLTGGVAKNHGVVRAMEKAMKMPVKVSPHSQLTGALGAAILAAEELSDQNIAVMA